jgi:chromosome segregation ATPase
VSKKETIEEIERRLQKIRDDIQDLEDKEFELYEQIQRLRPPPPAGSLAELLERRYKAEFNNAFSKINHITEFMAKKKG